MQGPYGFCNGSATGNNSCVNDVQISSTVSTCIDSQYTNFTDGSRKTESSNKELRIQAKNHTDENNNNDRNHDLHLARFGVCKICIAMTFCVILNIVTVIVLVAVKWQDWSQTFHVTADDWSTIADSGRRCLPCPQTPGSDVWLSREAGTDVNLPCCLQDTPEFKQYIKNIVNEILDSSTSSGIRRQTPLNTSTILPSSVNKHAMHVFLQHNQVEEESRKKARHNNNFARVHWTQRGNAAFVRPGINHTDGGAEFTISENGVYVMYSRLVFDSPRVRSADRHHQTETTVFGQRVVEEGRDVALLEDRRAVECVVDQVGVPCHSSTLFSAVRLTRNTRLSLHATPTRLLSTQQHTSFFGLYKID